MLFLKMIKLMINKKLIISVNQDINIQQEIQKIWMIKFLFDKIIKINLLDSNVLVNRILKIHKAVI